jgi:hypothetical protein
VADAFFIVIQTLPANPFPVCPLRMFFEDDIDDVMVRMFQKNHEIVLYLFLANRAYIIFHKGLSPGDISDLVTGP